MQNINVQCRVIGTTLASYHKDFIDMGVLASDGGFTTLARSKLSEAEM